VPGGLLGACARSLRELPEQEEADVVHRPLVDAERGVEHLQQPHEVDEEEGDEGDDRERVVQGADAGEEGDRDDQGDDRPDEDVGRGQEVGSLQQLAVAVPDEKVTERPRRLPRPRAPSLRSVETSFTDSAVVTMRNLRHFLRQPDLLVFSTIQPIMFVVLFVYVFGGAVGLALPPGVTYVDYLLPGIFVQSVTFRASNTAVGLSEDLRRGVIDRFRSMPMARSAVLLGRTIADLVRNVLIIGLMIVVGYLVGFRFQAGVGPALACVALVAAFGFALSWIFAFVSLVVRGAETAQTAGFVLLFPLVFASSVFVPVSTLPSWLQPIAKASPVTLTANAARTLALTGGVPDSLGGSLAWIVGILALFVPLSVWRYRRMS
jgi:ABC transporter DrrB family efflux protein